MIGFFPSDSLIAVCDLSQHGQYGDPQFSQTTHLSPRLLAYVHDTMGPILPKLWRTISSPTYKGQNVERKGCERLDGIKDRVGDRDGRDEGGGQYRSDVEKQQVTLICF